MVQSKVCRFCEETFTPSRNDKRIVYCKARCREKHWVQLNPERDRILKKRSRDRVPISCRECSKDVPMTRRDRGVVFCSLKCSKLRVKSNRKIRNDKVFKRFKDYKEGLGCQICKYSTYSGALDFHHANPEVKERRVTAGMFYSNSDTIKREINKCVLVCKNCHYELHQIYRDDIVKYNELMKLLEDKKIAQNGGLYEIK